MRTCDLKLQDCLDGLLEGVRTLTGTNCAHAIFLNQLRQSGVARRVCKNRALRLDVGGELDGEAGPAEASETPSVRVHRIDKVAGGEHWQSIRLEQLSMTFKSCQVLSGDFIHLRGTADPHDFQGAVQLCGAAEASQNEFPKG